MAQTTEADRALLKEKGLYAKERCDAPGCNNIIWFLRWNGTHGRVYHSEECYIQTEGAKVKTRKQRSEEPVAEKNGHRPPKKAYEVVKGLESLEKKILSKLSEKAYTTWDLKERLSKNGVAEKPDIHNAVHNLVTTGKIIKSGRGWAVAAGDSWRSSARDVSEVKSSPKSRDSSREQRETSSQKRVLVVDVPYAYDEPVAGVKSSKRGKK